MVTLVKNSSDKMIKCFLSTLLFLSLSTLLAQEKYPQDYFESPLDIPLILSGTFGELRSNHFHAGIDIKTQRRQGLPVYAIADGTVTRIKISLWGYGKALYVAHPNGYTSVYAHLQKFSPEIEAYIKKEQYKKQSYEIELFPKLGELSVTKKSIIAYTGNSGGSSGPHLHFEIRSSITEKPTNPLLYGYDVRDATDPAVIGLFGYPLSKDAHVNGNQEKIQLSFNRQADGSFLADKVSALGTIGFGFNGFDKQDMAPNKNGVYSVRQTVNGKVYSEYDFETFSFGETRYINTFIDYEHFGKLRQRIQKCFKESSNRLGIYNTLYNDGKINVQDFFPVNTFYKDFYIDLKKGKDTVGIHNKTAAVHRNFTLTFDVSKYSEKERKQLFIARIDDDGDPHYTRTYKRNGIFTARTRNLGSYTLMKDTIPPTIHPRNFKEKQWLKNYDYLSLRITDDLSGIKDYSATLNGTWILMEYEPKTKTITYNFDERIANLTECNLKVFVTDNVGNSTTFESTFFTK